MGIVVVGEAHATLLPSSSQREYISHMDCVTQTIFAHLRSSTCWVAHHVRMSSHCHGFPNSHTLEVLQAGSRRRACQRLSLVAARAGFPPNGPESNYGGLHGGNTKGRLAALRYYQKKVPPQKNPNWIPIACAHGLAEPRHQETPQLPPLDRRSAAHRSARPQTAGAAGTTSWLSCADPLRSGAAR